ncbi:MAG: hypothetical protein WD738_11405 [Pirellulales bacterium]
MRPIQRLTGGGTVERGPMMLRNVNTARRLPRARLTKGNGLDFCAAHGW